MATQRQKDAALAALRQLEIEQVPAWEQFAITDDLLRSIVDAVIGAYENNAPPPQKGKTR